MYGVCLYFGYLSYVCQYIVKVELLLLLLAFLLLSFYELNGLVVVVFVVVGSVLALRITVGETICDIWITLNIFMSHGCNNDLNTYIYWTCTRRKIWYKLEIDTFIVIKILIENNEIFRFPKRDWFFYVLLYLHFQLYVEGCATVFIFG